MSDCETGVVVEKHDSYILIETDPVASCASCGPKSKCMVANPDNNTKRVIKAYSDLPVEEGQKVMFEMTVSILKLSFFFYLLPALLMIAGFYAGSAYITLFEDSEINSMVGGFGTLILSGLIIFLIAALDRKSKRTHAKVIEIVS
jgi:positive regulator of sigma E activity